MRVGHKFNMEVKDLINQEHPSYRSHFDHHDFSTDWLDKMKRHNPEIMKQPIALRGKKTILIVTRPILLKFIIANT